jgi:hypothetical protein
MAPISEFADVLDRTHDTADSSMEEVRTVFEQMRVDSGLAELEPAVKKNLVRFNENIALDHEMDTVIWTFIEELKRYLLDPKWFVLLDSEIASLARALINEGHLKPPQRAISNAGEAALGPATRERENSHLSSNGHGERPGENPQNPATPQTDCQTCGAGLGAPWSQQRGTCEKCWLAKEPTT